MSEYRGYTGMSLTFLKESNVKVGDSVKVTEDLTYTGILMPRYEHTDDKHIVLKLKSGYNIGIEVNKIKKIELLSSEKIETKSSPQIKTDSSLPKVLLLSTGGTIASKIDYRTGAVTPALSATELNSAVPELAEIANIDAEVIFSEYSENLGPEHWKKIAEKLDSYAKSDYKGIVIGHGTDTMQYTAAFLSFALAGYPIPIVLVGSQRSSDRPSSDAVLNLISAFRFVVESNTRGVFVVMHHNESDDLVVGHIGTRVRKNHTSKRSAFQTIGGNPAFLIFDGTGLGHVGKTMYEGIKKANESGLFMGMTSQCIDGRVGMNVYESGRDLLELGIVPLSDMISETAMVKAMWALGNSGSPVEMKDLMLKNIASEFSD